MADPCHDGVEDVGVREAGAGIHAKAGDGMGSIIGCELMHVHRSRQVIGSRISRRHVSFLFLNPIIAILFILVRMDGRM